MDALRQVYNLDKDPLFRNDPTELQSLRNDKNQAYSERDQLVCVLSKIFPAHLSRHSEADKSWEEDWRWIVCIHFPFGQGAWHIHDSERPWFKHLGELPDHWDGHTTQEKYTRLAQLPAPVMGGIDHYEDPKTVRELAHNFVAMAKRYPGIAENIATVMGWFGQAYLMGAADMEKQKK